MFQNKRRNSIETYFFPTDILCHSYLCTKKLIYIYALSKLSESAESAVRNTKLNGIVGVVGQDSNAVDDITKTINLIIAQTTNYLKLFRGKSVI